MTLRLRRKHQITALSIASRAHKPLASSALLALVLTTGLTTADAAGPEKESGIKSAISSPIRWLRERSAKKRWEKQKAEELLRQAEQAQAVQPGIASPEFTEPIDVDAPGGATLTFSGELPGLNASDESPVGEVPADSALPLEAESPAVSPVDGIAPYEPLLSPEFDSPADAADFIEAGYQDTTSDPKKLRPITEILPYADYRPEMKVETGIDPTLKAPQEVELSNEMTQPRQMDAILYQWQASNLYHYPLYFEDPALERYGHAHDELVQPFVSLGQFGLQLVGLPYQMTIDPVCKKRYALGWFRPGECAPKQIKQIPWNTKAAINQAGVTTGLWFALP